MQPPRDTPRPLSSLSVRLIATIVVVILAVEVVIYLPSVANFRTSWLEDRLHVGAVAARVIDAVPDAMDLPEDFIGRLLSTAEATAIAYRDGDRSLLIAPPEADMPEQVQSIDLRKETPVGLIAGALDTLFLGSDRMLRIVGEVRGAPGAVVEVLMPESRLRSELLLYSRDIFILSLTIASLTALVIFLFVNRSVIGPIRRLTQSMVAFRQAPENARLILPPSDRADEIGIAERGLAAMQADLFAMLRQRRHLADLGLAVAKINHDLRNTLSSAQLLSDQVATLDDPKVQRLAPRLVTTLDKAIGFAQSVLDYGRQSVAPPRPVPVGLKALIDECAFDAGLVGHPAIGFLNQVPDGLTLVVDRDQMARVFVNVLRNAREALERASDAAAPVVTVAAGPAGQFATDLDDQGRLGPEDIAITISDNGPGLPPRARDNLFVAFEGSARAGGTGLGLAIARELVEAHGGRIAYADLMPGTSFTIVLPGGDSRP